MSQQIFHVGDTVYYASKYCKPAKISQLHGKKWAKILIWYKLWWQTSDLLTPDEWVAWKTNNAVCANCLKPGHDVDACPATKTFSTKPVMFPSDVLPGTPVPATPKKKPYVFNDNGAQWVPGDPPTTPPPGSFAGDIATIQAKVAEMAAALLSGNKAITAFAAELAAVTGLPTAECLKILKKTIETQSVVPPTTEPPPAPVTPETKTVWKPVVPGTLKPGDVVSWLAAGSPEPGKLTAEVVSTSGKAWVKLSVKPTWRRAATLFVRQTYQVLPNGLLHWAPPTPNWTAWKNYWAPWHDALTQNEKAALANYCGSGYTTINALLRTGKAHGYQASTIANLDSAIGKGVVPFDIEVYRAGSSKFDRATPVGSIIRDLGFFSTSTDRDFAVKWHHPGALFTVRVPKGTRAAYVQLVSQHKHERELILPRGSRFRLVEITHENDRVHATLEVLP